MNKKDIKEYQRSLKPWAPKHDVTMVDVIVSGYVDEAVYAVDAIIFKMIGNKKA